MAVEETAEQFAERAHDLGLIDRRRLSAVWSELGTRDVPLADFITLLLRKEMLTQLQVERLQSDKRDGYFYGKYKVLYFLGKGSFARVYRAVHADTGQVYAIKVLRNTIKSQPFVNYEDVVEQFLREAQTMQSLRHPNIVPVYDVGKERGRPYMAMEFVEGRNLREFLRVRKKMTVEETLRLGEDIASALDFALSKGLTHRDLKPSNVLIASNGRAKLVDFGLAATIAEARSGGEKSSTSRSIDYAGLEKASNAKKDDPRSDIFFAGCMLYQMLTGEYPLLETKNQSERMSVARFRDVKPIIDYEPDLPGPVVALVHKAMDLDLNKRFAKPSELLAEIRSVRNRLQSDAADDAASETGQAKLEREGENHSVMVVEANIEMQDALRDLLKRRGYRVLVISDTQRALARFEGGEKPAEVVIFGTLELGTAALEAFNQFGENEGTKAIPAVLFLAEHHKDLEAKARLATHRVLLHMPLKVRQLRGILLHLVTQNGGTSPADSPAPTGGTAPR